MRKRSTEIKYYSDLDHHIAVIIPCGCDKCPVRIKGRGALIEFILHFQAIFFRKYCSGELVEIKKKNLILCKKDFEKTVKNFIRKIQGVSKNSGTCLASYFMG